ncbi:MAG: rhodanese-like domain-containing protein [Planctomycetota bacterium]|nr:rhodanese-like domain-containing protein [Planctomycetota bacterium]
MVAAQNSAAVTDVTPEQLEQWLAAGEAFLVDVREPIEHAEERIEGAELVPLSRFEADAIRAAHPDARLVFHCRSGKRSADAATRFQSNGEPVFHLAGGIEGWKSSGRPTVRPQSAPRIPIMRQVQIAAGSLVLLGVVLGVLISPWFLAIPAFVGSGLTFAGATGWCGMAMMLAKMPWNRASPTSCKAN